jgi:hypothetical protein
MEFPNCRRTQIEFGETFELVGTKGQRDQGQDRNGHLLEYSFPECSPSLAWETTTQPKKII